MSKLRALVLLLVLALVAAACGEVDEASDTTGVPNGTIEDGSTTTTEPPGVFPWAGAQKPAGPLDSDLDAISFLNGESHQVGCTHPDCGTATATVTAGLNVIDGVQTMCPSPVAYVPGQLLAFEDELGEDVTPRLVADPETEVPYELPDGWRLYDIGADPIEFLAANNDLIGRAHPNYVFLPTPSWRFSPADEKTPASSDGLIDGPLFDGGTVTVIDEFAGSGHGEFVSSIIKQLSGTSVIEKHVQLQELTEAGDLVDYALIADTLTVAALINAAGPGVVNVSLGTYGCVIDGQDIPPTMLETEIVNSGASVVAAAGNDDVQDPLPLFYPAAFPTVVSVGALAWSGQWFAADFSNTNNVDVWAPGTAIVAQVGNETFAWSGTSFAAPHYAACLAAGSCQP